jgi:predicted DNA-binding transcriptional regulator AlpA
MTPPRLLLSEVVALSRLSAATLRRRWRAGKFPAPIDRGKQLIFDRAAVLTAIGAPQEPEAKTRAKWIVRSPAESTA